MSVKCGISPKGRAEIGLRKFSKSCTHQREQTLSWACVEWSLRILGDSVQWGGVGNQIYHFCLDAHHLYKRGRTWNQSANLELTKMRSMLQYLRVM